MKKPVTKSAAKTTVRSASKSASAKTDATAKVDTTAPAPRAPKNILTAGIKALTSAHEEAVARQSRVFESLLGLGQRREAAPEPEAPPLDPFGFKKFEDVFDQRVARALQHLGIPTAEAIADLRSEVVELRETVAKLEAQSRKR